MIPPLVYLYLSNIIIHHDLVKVNSIQPYYIKIIVNGTYDYEVPYNVGNVTDTYEFINTFPCTSACRHVINNKNTKKVRLEIDYYRSMIITNFEMSPSYSYLYAVLVEKNK